jgi:hypothetical protein
MGCLGRQLHDAEVDVVQEGVIQLIAYPNGIIKNQNRCVTGLGIGDCCCTGYNRDVVDWFVLVRVRSSIAFTTSRLYDNRIATENNCVRM